MLYKFCVDIHQIKLHVTTDQLAQLLTHGHIMYVLSDIGCIESTWSQTFIITIKTYSLSEWLSLKMTSVCKTTYGGIFAIAVYRSNSKSDLSTVHGHKTEWLTIILLYLQ